MWIDIDSKEGEEFFSNLYKNIESVASLSVLYGTPSNIRKQISSNIGFGGRVIYPDGEEFLRVFLVKWVNTSPYWSDVPSLCITAFSVDVCDDRILINDDENFIH